MQSNNKKPETELTPWEMFQESRFGNILNLPPREDEEDEHRLTTQEEAYFFNLENEPQ